MKEIKNIDKIYLDEFDIYVETYLTYDQIQKISESIATQEDWAVRQQTMDMLILYYTTDISQEEMEKVGHDDLLKSGIIDEVKNSIKNLNQVQEAIDYMQSPIKALKQFSDKLPELKKSLQEVINNGRTNNKRRAIS